MLVMIRRRADSSRVGAVSGNCNNLLWYGLMSSRSKCRSGSLRLESVFSAWKMSPQSEGLSGSLRLKSAFVNIEMSPRCEVPGARLTNGATLTGRIPSYVVETEIVTICLSDPKD